jgi:hypothetical protein
VFYNIYGSEYNKETLHTLKNTFTLNELLKHKEFIDIQEDLTREHYEEMRN